MSIELNKPYKIIPLRHKRYEAHYKILALNSLVIPIKALGEEVSCDIRWEDDNGELHLIRNAVFVNENLIPVIPELDGKLFELWKHYYDTVRL